jgi:hypothetical protein
MIAKKRSRKSDREITIAKKRSRNNDLAKNNLSYVNVLYKTIVLLRGIFEGLAKKDDFRGIRAKNAN